MNEMIERETLQRWLEQKKPVTILDLQPEEAYREWRIPGSVHVEQYEALKAGAPDAMKDVDLPTDKPVVTVCPRGKTSALAAAQLRERGFDAQSLAGGLREWSLAWNTAEVTIPDSDAVAMQVRRTGKGCLSYLVGSEGDAVVIDASVDANVYRQLADHRGWQIKAVVETLIQADHLSRSKALAAELEADIYLPAQDRVTFPFTSVQDGDDLRFGKATLKAFRTPGHTPESTSYSLGGALFTGDTLFINSVGRPDLDATSDETAGRAARLYESLQMLTQLPGDTIVLPAHTSDPVPFDGEPVQSSLSEVKRRVEALKLPKEAFIERVTRLMPPPPNFERIVELNESGELPDDTGDLEAGANRCAA